jgi:hypothetical protein
MDYSENKHDVSFCDYLESTLKARRKNLKDIMLSEGAMNHFTKAAQSQVRLEELDRVIAFVETTKKHYYDTEAA